jgi:hypothetical protein
MEKRQVMVKTSPDEALLMQLAENIQREELRTHTNNKRRKPPFSGAVVDGLLRGGTRFSPRPVDGSENGLTKKVLWGKILKNFWRREKW